MKNIHVVKTGKPSRLHLGKSSLVLCDLNHNPDVINTHHIYITSDEALPYDDSIFDNGAFYHRDAVGDVYIITKHTFKPNPRFCKKIILTTDQDLIKDGVQAIDDEFLEWFVENPSCEEVELENHVLELGYNHYKISIPKEEPKQEFCDNCNNDICCCIVRTHETIEEAAESKYNYNLFGYEKYRYGFIEGAKWQQQRMYSEEEVIKIVEKSRATGLTAEYLLLTEQFKKK